MWILLRSGIFEKQRTKQKIVKEVEFLSTSIWSKKIPISSLFSDYLEINKSLLIIIAKIKPKSLKTLHSFFYKSINILGETNSI